MAFRSIEEQDNFVTIKVVGVGGGGNNAVNRMIKDEVLGVEFVAVNTDKQALNHSQATHKVLIGDNVTHGRGAGANPEVGRKAAEESKAQIEEVLKGTEMVFITAGMGGGTGTGAAPFVAKVAKEIGILTVGIVTKPFAFEGSRKMSQAERGIEELLQEVDALIVIPNERLKLVTDAKITLANAFEMADGILKQGVQSITELIQGHGFINLDFADVTSNMKDAGYAHMCVASAKGKDKAETAARNAITSPLLETSIAGARKILLNFTADSNIDLEDIYRAADIIKEEAHPDVDIIWGVILDDTLQDELRIAVIASCFDESVVSTPVKKQPAVNNTSTESFFNIPAAPKAEPAPAPAAPAAAEPEYEPIATRQPRTGSVQRPNGNERPSARRASSVVDDDDSNDSFLKLLNDITKSK
ncbi:MAG: cell division protein FtsZ [Ruminococcaceae bacterium]|nr:cell division protein FtsZ [Oscillospiraceae bacterium]